MQWSKVAVGLPREAIKKYITIIDAETRGRVTWALRTDQAAIMTQTVEGRPALCAPPAVANSGDCYVQVVASYLRDSPKVQCPRAGRLHTNKP